jgi:hypothetical protein
MFQRSRDAPELILQKANEFVQPRFRKGWESMAELRMLDLPDVSQRRSGALLAVYRYFGEHLKVGAGYNFTDFSDDLTDLSYRHQGVFVNLVGTK